ncbi:hypothetical protein E1B28_003469 [Marasmius oreades]|nr:uncharacterized protein E1B28_003469 [Marasmius oreades]KAG7085941.1 hypothetical protein E1B28_003469 [Marasmius oreades]
MIEPLTVTAPDGASLAYEIQGSQWIGRALPIGMTSLRGDWERLASPLVAHRPVLIYDHRGMGDSTYSTPSRKERTKFLSRTYVYFVNTFGSEFIHNPVI